MKSKQIYCLSDCLAYVIQKDGRYDYRPLYFGVWNAPFAITDNGLSYYSDSIFMDDVLNQFIQLYGESLHIWHDYKKDKMRNFETLRSKLEIKNSFEIVLVDLFHLDYPNQCYQFRHRPHILIVDHCYNGSVHLIDPFFNWEGYVPENMFWQAYYYEELSLGFSVDTSLLKKPDKVTVSQVFKNNYDVMPSQFITEAENIIQKTIEDELRYPIKTLPLYVEQAGIISKRWGSYELAFSYFSDALQLDVEASIVAVSNLLKEWESIMLSIIRASIKSKHESLSLICNQIRQAGEHDSLIKQELWDVFQKWEGTHW